MKGDTVWGIQGDPGWNQKIKSTVLSLIQKYMQANVQKFPFRDKGWVLTKILIFSFFGFIFETSCDNKIWKVVWAGCATS